MTIGQMSAESDMMMETMRRRAIERHFEDFQIFAVKWAVKFFSDGVDDKAIQAGMGEHIMAIVELGEDYSYILDRRNELYRMVKNDMSRAVAFLDSIEEE